VRIIFTVKPLVANIVSVTQPPDNRRLIKQSMKKISMKPIEFGTVFAIPATGIEIEITKGGNI